MKVKILLILFISFSSSGSFAQSALKWEEIHKQWNLNSANYPENETHLDTLYFKLMKFKLVLAENKHFSMSFPKDSLIEGQYEIDEEKKNIVFKPEGKKKFVYHVLELNKEHLTLSADEKYTWAYYLSLTSHE